MFSCISVNINLFNPSSFLDPESGECDSGDSFEVGLKLVYERTLRVVTGCVRLQSKLAFALLLLGYGFETMN